MKRRGGRHDRDKPIESNELLREPGKRGGGMTGTSPVTPLHERPQRGLPRVHLEEGQGLSLSCRPQSHFMGDLESMGQAQSLGYTECVTEPRQRVIS